MRIRHFCQEFNCEFDLDTPREVSAGFVQRIVVTLYFPDAEDERFTLRVSLLGHAKTSSGKIDKRSRPFGSMVSSRDEDLKLLIEAIDATVTDDHASAASFRKVREIAQSDLTAFVARTGG
jgi:hypothetical protein